eukprot:366438-Chlamydomonas_euryale.AAC.16
MCDAHAGTTGALRRADSTGDDMSVELSLEEIRSVAQQLGLVLLREDVVDAPYIGARQRVSRAPEGHLWHTHQRLLASRSWAEGSCVCCEEPPGKLPPAVPCQRWYGTAC